MIMQVFITFEFGKNLHGFKTGFIVLCLGLGQSLLP